MWTENFEIEINPDIPAEFIEAMTAMGITLREPVSPLTVNAYWRILKKYPLNQVITAFDKAMETCRFFPKSAELVELMTGGRGGGNDPTVAWTEVLRTLEARGAYESVTFQDGAVAAAIEQLGGWVQLGEMSDDELTLQRIPAKFEALYKRAVDLGYHRQPGTVLGRFAINNAAVGLEDKAPKPLPAKTFGREQIRPAYREGALPPNIEEPRYAEPASLPPVFFDLAKKMRLE